MTINPVFALSNVMMQPTTLCNLDCTYCYLPYRQKNLRMGHSVAARVAQGLRNMDCSDVSIVWHGGEPLVCGISHFELLLKPFQSLYDEGKVRHSVQTNATVIDSAWCDFFLTHQVHVGVSVDGPEWANSSRVSWQNDPAYLNIRRGIDALVYAKVPFTAICVVQSQMLQRGREVYDFFKNLGCTEVGFNVEEQVGVNKKTCDSHDAVVQFWNDVCTAWANDRSIQVREFKRILNWMGAVCDDAMQQANEHEIDIFPCVGFDGSVVLLSPELLGTQAIGYDTFAAGNILRHDLSEILANGRNLQYVQDFLKGVVACSLECDHFTHCGGGSASNKYFELGTTGGTETAHCRNSEKRLVKGLLNSLDSERRV